MCGIIAYIGRQEASPILIEGLKRLEYRGYDSCGMVVVGDKGAKCLRTSGKIANLEKKLNDSELSGVMGFGHTRWATHGAPTERNAHPHTDCDGKIYVIHNGIIENYMSLKTDLIHQGHIFVSDTDTEVIAHMVESCYQGDLLAAVRKSLEKIEGTFGLAILHVDEPNRIVLARRGSPLVIGVGTNEMFGASDVSAILRHTDKVIYLDDNEIAVIQEGSFKILSINQEHVQREPETVEWKLTDTDRNGFTHYMLKEIYEQPETVLNAIRGRIFSEEGSSKLGGLDSVIQDIKRMRHLVLLSCGTSYHAGLLGRYIFERLTEISVDVEIASEYRYRHLTIHPGTVVLGISQSGETADTIAALREAKRKGALTLGLVNVVGSTIARETSAGVYNHAGPEIGVASTKIFTSQAVILLLLALLVGRYKKLSMSDGVEIIRAVQKLPDLIQEVLEQAENIRLIAKELHHVRSCLFLGRQFYYPIAMEGALKLKEVSYIHAEGYPAGEMKHGPIALVGADCPVVAICPRSALYDKMISNIMEIKARSTPLIVVGNAGDENLPAMADYFIPIPEAHDLVSPILANVPLQLFAYYMALYRGCEIDKPRNLAKSVTVE